MKCGSCGAELSWLTREHECRGKQLRIAAWVSMTLAGLVAVASAGTAVLLAGDPARPAEAQIVGWSGIVLFLVLAGVFILFLQEARRSLAGHTHLPIRWRHWSFQTWYLLAGLSIVGLLQNPDGDDDRILVAVAMAAAMPFLVVAVRSVQLMVAEGLLRPPDPPDQPASPTDAAGPAGSPSSR